MCLAHLQFLTCRYNQSMAENNAKKSPQKQKRGRGPMFPRLSFINMIAAAILIFLLITGIYAQFTNREGVSSEVSLTMIAQDMEHGKVSSLTIQGDQVT